MKTGAKVAIGVAAGVVAGAIAGVLLAPKSGKETREDIKNYAISFKEKVAKKAGEAGKLTKEKYDKIVDSVAKQYKTAKKFSADDLKDIVADVKSKWSEVEKSVASKKR